MVKGLRSIRRKTTMHTPNVRVVMPKKTNELVLNPSEVAGRATLVTTLSRPAMIPAMPLPDITAVV